MLKAIQKMLNSLTLRQQHFLHQRKNLYIPILGRIFSGEPDSDDNHRRAFTLEFFIISLPDFIRDSVEGIGNLLDFVRTSVGVWDCR
mgnify:FL=1